MTYRELFERGKPIVFYDTLHVLERICYSLELGKVWVESEWGGAEESIPDYLLDTEIMAEVLDWFEEEPLVSETQPCRCDLWTILMVSGCKCGGI